MKRLRFGKMMNYVISGEIGVPFSPNTGDIQLINWNTFNYHVISAAILRYLIKN